MTNAKIKRKISIKDFSLKNLTVKEKIVVVFIIITIVMVILSIIYYNTVLNSRLVMINSFQKMFKSLSPVVEPLKTDFSFSDDLNISGNLTFSSYDKALSENEISSLANKFSVDYSVRKQVTPPLVFSKFDAKYQDEDLFQVKYLNEESSNYLYLGDIYSKYIKLGDTNLETFGNNFDDYMYLFEMVVKELNKNVRNSSFQKNVILETTPGVEVTLKFNQDEVVRIMNAIIKKIKTDERANQTLKNIIPSFNGTALTKADLPIQSVTVYTKQKVLENHLQALTITIKNLNGKENIFNYDNEKGNPKFIFNYYQINYKANNGNFRFEDSSGHSFVGNKINDAYNYALDFQPISLFFKVNNEIKNNIFNYDYSLSINDEVNSYNLFFRGQADHLAPIIDEEVDEYIKVSDITENDKKLIEERIIDIINNKLGFMIPVEIPEVLDIN